MAISLVNIVNVIVSGVGRGRLTPNVNNVAIFTNDEFGSSEEYKTYITPRAVEIDYGTDSLTYKMAQAIFAQNPDIASGGGLLIIVPMINAVSAEGGNFTTPDLTANIVNFLAVTDGSLTITVDGVDTQLSSLNFSNAKTLNAIAAIFQARLPNVFVSIEDNKIIFTSKTFGTDSALVITPSSGGTDITGVTFLNIDGGTETVGINSSGESLIAAVTRVKAKASFASFVTNINLTSDDILETSNYVQSQDRALIFVHQFVNKADNIPAAGIINQIKVLGNKSTRCILHTKPSVLDANLVKCSALSANNSVLHNTSGSTKTISNKPLVGVLPDDSLDDNDFQNAKITGADYYCYVDGEPTFKCNGANGWWDSEYNRQWLQFELQNRLFNYLRLTRTKIPQTEQGMDGLKGVANDVFSQAVRNNFLAPGQWNSAETFGDKESFLDNISEIGYFIYSQPIAQQTQEERVQRIAPLIQSAGKEAGAADSLIINVLIEE